MRKLTDEEAEALLAEMREVADGPKWDDYHERAEDIKARLEFPCGEITNPDMAGFLWAWSIQQCFHPAPITEKDRFNAQGLEGKYYVELPLITALLAYEKLPRHRRQLFVDREMNQP